MRTNIRKLLFSQIILIVGVVLLLTCTASMRDKKTFEPVNVTISEIEVVPGIGDDDDSYTVFVDYQVNGKSYHEQYDTYSSSYEVGDVLESLYDPADPTDVRNAKNTVEIIAVAAGAVMVLIGLFGLIRLVAILFVAARK